MSQDNVIGSFFAHFLLLSFLSIGGAGTTIPDMHRFLVESHGWMSDAQFSAMYAISQASPGPNVLFVALFGWQIAGLAGAIAGMVAICGPSSVIALAFEYFAGRSPQARWPGLVRRGLAALTIGLLGSTGWVLAASVDHRWTGAAVTLATIALMLKTRVHPLVLVALGAGAGLLGLV
ncbi:chromate transporter [Cupriavidus sp. USMAA2-4]|uniref:Chromate transporter n=1 Tax=Cupriavidus malaysiensis TaxID=367825 RepID=A0ABN4TIV4_9BURK|nr:MULTISPECIES: chromate transporter [Cupriavidus]AOY93292.1 chromate transporter [Cupriavidus sp. USMAA2-4]AOZ00416.1 chromate transporter [Cupriavidus sp. USMAHM13]AOZ07162.1 chromate transporter [Cupriavidus malaysiensis]